MRENMLLICPTSQAKSPATFQHDGQITCRARKRVKGNLLVSLAHRPYRCNVVLFVRCLVDNGPRQTMTAALWIAAARRRHAKSAEPATFILAAAAIMPNAIPNRQRKLCFATGEIRLQKGSVRMRQEQQSLSPAQRAADFNINFQITDAGARRACSVTIEAASRFDAEIIFRQNWTTIEQLARLNLAAKDRNEISWRRVQDGVAAAATVK